MKFKNISTSNIEFYTIFIWFLVACNDSTQESLNPALEDPESRYQAAQEYLINSRGKNDVEQALLVLMQLAEQGYTPAQNKLGFLYSQGLYVTKDPSLALHWYEKAATAGFSISQYNVAEMYRLGIGIEKDERTAFQWYQRSALKGYPHAMLRVAESYSGGSGTRKDLGTAYAWYQLAKGNGVNVPDSFINSITRQLTEEQLAEAEILIADIKWTLSVNR